MSSRKPCHMPFRKRIPPFTFAALYCPDLFLSVSLLFRIVFTRTIQQFE